jgi:peptidase inhibitor I78 family protein
MRSILITVAGALALAGCATVPADGEPQTPGDTCQAAPGQRFIGQRATAESGSAIVAATGSTRLRWVPPRTAVTMEYAFGRVTVSYDDNYAITAVSCS